MGCAAASERSMMESRRCARPTRRSGEIHNPAPSGPRCTIISRIRTRYSAVTWKLLFLNASTPEIPHICRHRAYTLTPGSVMEEMTEQTIREFWDAHPCGESQVESLCADHEAFFRRYDAFRYEKEAHILKRLDAIDFKGKHVLEIGLGQGADS